MKATFSTALALLMMLLSDVAIAATFPLELADAASHGRMVSLQSWSPDINSDVSLTSGIVLAVKRSDQPQNVLIVYQGTRRIFSFTSEQSPVSMFTAGGEAGNLATVWEAGDGTYILCVFAFESGKVKKVLEASSKLMPEFVYTSTPPGSLIVDSKQPVPGGYWSQRIIIANIDWVHDAKSGEQEYLPLTANIFMWDGKRYQVRENVKWTERLR